MRRRGRRKRRSSWRMWKRSSEEEREEEVEEQMEEEEEETLEAEGPCWRSSLNLSLPFGIVFVNVNSGNPWLTLFLGGIF